MKTIIIFACILTIIYTTIFFIPQSTEKLSLDPQHTNQPWRYITYQFAHLNTTHLIQNIIGLALITLIAIELKTRFSNFTTTYLTAGLLSVIPIWLIISFTTLGASNAILGGFGLISQETKKYEINSWIIITTISALIFLQTITTYFTNGTGKEFTQAITQDSAHFSGLIFGIGAYYLLKKITPIIERKKTRMLRGG